MTVRIAVIGTGIMGQDHLRIFAEDLAHVQVTAVCDAAQERARQVADRHGIRNVFSDPLQAIASAEVDAVVIASPDETHAPLSMAALKAGKHVLCEKPLSQSSAECLRVMELESQLGAQRVQIGFMRRFDPSYTAMKANHSIGAPLMLHCLHRNVEAPANFTGAMAITNSAPHEFDAARFVLDDDIRFISVYQPQCVDASAVGAPVFMVLQTAAGRLVSVEINNNARYGYDVQAELVGMQGTVSLAATSHSTVRAQLQSMEAYAADWRPRFAEAYRLQNKAWIAAIQSGVPNPIASNAWDAYCATMVAEAGARALHSGQREEIVLAKKPALYA